MLCLTKFSHINSALCGCAMSPQHLRISLRRVAPSPITPPASEALPRALAQVPLAPSHHPLQVAPSPVTAPCVRGTAPGGHTSPPNNCCKLRGNCSTDRHWTVLKFYFGSSLYKSQINVKTCALHLYCRHANPAETKRKMKHFKLTLFMKTWTGTPFLSASFDFYIHSEL